MYYSGESTKKLKVSHPTTEQPLMPIVKANPSPNAYYTSMIFSDTKMMDNVHPRCQMIVMDEVNHLYYVTKGEEKIKVKLSGTGFKELFFPKFDPIDMVNKMFMRARCTSSTYTLPRTSTSIYNGKTWNEIYNIFTGKFDIEKSAAYRGTTWHYMIEMYMHKHYRCTNFDALSNDIKVMYFLRPDSDDLSSPVDPKYEEYRPVALMFIQIYEDHIVKQKWKPYAAEMRLFDDEIQGYLAGTADAIFKREAKGQTEYFLVDWKTISSPVNKVYGEDKFAYYPIQRFSNKKSTHYSVQLNLYAYWLQKYYGMNVTSIKAFCFNLKEKTFELVDIVYDIKLITDIYSFYSNYCERMDMYFKWGPVEHTCKMKVYMPKTKSFSLDSI